MTTITIFQAGEEVISTGTDLHEAAERANDFGFDVNYDEIEIAKDGHGLIDGQIYYSVSQ